MFLSINFILYKNYFISTLSSIELESVVWSTCSMVPPIGSPLANLVTLTGISFNISDNRSAVASPSTLASVAIIISFISRLDFSLNNKDSIFKWFSSIPSIGDIKLPKIWFILCF